MNVRKSHWRWSSKSTMTSTKGTSKREVLNVTLKQVFFIEWLTKIRPNVQRLLIGDDDGLVTDR